MVGCAPGLGDLCRHGGAVHRGFVFVCYWAEGHGNTQLRWRSASIPANMEGKEVRFGIATSSLWATATTAASYGSVNAMHDSFTPLGGMIPLINDPARRDHLSAASAPASTACCCSSSSPSSSPA